VSERGEGDRGESEERGIERERERETGEKERETELLRAFIGNRLVNEVER
jgi:hypothetical protein